MGPISAIVENLNDYSNGGMSTPRVAFGFVARLATGLFGFWGSKRLTNSMDATSQDQTALQNGLEQNSDGTEMINVECEKLTRDSQVSSVGTYWRWFECYACSIRDDNF